MGNRLIFLLAALILSSPTSANELQERESIKNTVSQLFIKEQFEDLSKLSIKYLKTEERTSSGLWKLTLYNSAISGITDKNNRDEKYWSDLEAKTLRWIKSQPDSPSGYIAYATILMNHAWMYRGGGWSHEVREEDWEPFNAYVRKAKQHLIENKSIASNDPRWYETMLSIATAEGWSDEDFETLINEATSKHPFFYQIYFMAIDYLTPKWHGNKEKIEEFARKSVITTAPKDKFGMYARIYWYASQTNYGPALFTDSAVTWDSMNRSIDDVLAQYPDQWNINNFAYFACLAGDKDKTYALIKQIQPTLIDRAWGITSFYYQCKSWSSNE